MPSDNPTDSRLVTRPVVVTRPTSPSNKDACLIQIYPTGLTIGTRHPLNEKDAILGRDDDCDITVHDPSISRRHSRLESTAGGYRITDLQSTNGTFVNNVPANRTKLTDGDYVRLGTCLFRFLAGGNVEAEYHEELYRMAILDGLTGTHNKRYLLDHLEREIDRSTRHERPLALILIDVDHFKTINDTMGHLAGDLALRELSLCLRPNVRKYDLLARYGGEEFAVVLSETSRHDAIEIAEKLRRAVELHPFESEGRRFQVTISLGVATVVRNEPLEPEELIRLADLQLYSAKRAGRNRVSA
ncbi:diguanylate cyclase (GGDEF) domain-containing protein [Singulisphaera sp. GP187]|uniref:GGDEF domain-containing protein n=1 Tax=Singulisphaera sp. GP187 TaxID=1882752 RepID=UPI0009295A94|nr:GGDEF domain-containing protein [Singulisphaera sp. GP187]SIO16779.1 diguanylate cyclase (GGDEF) domain-containing protein [Singulisphaera sp. GP187]